MTTFNELKEQIKEFEEKLLIYGISLDEELGLYIVNTLDDTNKEFFHFGLSDVLQFDKFDKIRRKNNIVIIGG